MQVHVTRPPPPTVHASLAAIGWLAFAFAILGIHFHARAQRRVAKSDAFSSSVLRLPLEAFTPLAATTRTHS